MQIGSVIAVCAVLLADLASISDDPTFAPHVPLDGQPNFRDIGGYKTNAGQTVRRGLVSRSGELPRLTDG
jgi:protein-tyrosine phosphatase